MASPTTSTLARLKRFTYSPRSVLVSVGISAVMTQPLTCLTCSGNGAKTCLTRGVMTELPAFLDSTRPQVPDLAVPRGVTPFYLPDQPVRGRLIRLGPLAATLLSRHNHAPPVKALLGQAMALAAALATALKFKGSFSVQA